MKFKPTIAILFSVSLALSACAGSSDPNEVDSIKFDPPNTDFAANLNIEPPVDAEEAKAIAAEAAGGTALSVEEETEDGELLFEVTVDTPTGLMEVEVRASDGGVVEIEPEDDDDGEDEDGEDD